MTLDQMRYFIEAANFQHVRHAAQSLSISSSSVSAAISALESELGCQLFERRSRKIYLTHEGKLLHEKMLSILKTVSDLKPLVEGEDEFIQGRYKLGASPFLAVKALTPVWNQLAQGHPGLQVEIFSPHSAEVVSNVIDGKFEYGLCFSPFDHPELLMTRLYDGLLVPVVRKKHPILSKKKYQITELNNYPAAMHKAMVGVASCEVHPVFEKFGIKTQTQFLFDNDFIVIEQLLSTNYWTMIPDVIAREYSSKVEILNVPKNWDATYYISFFQHRNKSKSRLGELLIDKLKVMF